MKRKRKNRNNLEIIDVYQEVIVNIDLCIAVPAKSNNQIFEELDKLSKRDILKLALSQLDFLEEDESINKTLN